MFNIPTTEIINFLTTYGYWGVLIGVAIESMGIPFPGETILIASAIYAGKTHQTSIILVIVAAAVGAIIGDNIGFQVGHAGGYRLLRRYGHIIHLNERKLKLGQYLFMKHGGKVVFFGRFFALLRAWAAFLAGSNRMNRRNFLFFNALGGIIWACVYGLGGYILGDNFERLRGPFGIATVILGIIILIALFFFLHHNEKRLEDEAEREIPGPLFEP